MEQTEKYKIYDTAPICPQGTAKNHLTKFVQSFVNKNYIDRYNSIFAKNLKKNSKHSSKIEDHLRQDICKILSSKPNNIQAEKTGVFYDFTDDPIIININEAFILGDYSDAIFSIDEGLLAVYFSHEGHFRLCSL